MYYVVLGDFDDFNLLRSYENFDESEARWILFENILSVVYFVMATFITQITILNMLIAIMSATHTNHNDMIDENSKAQRLLLLAEFNVVNNIYRCLSEYIICWPFVFLYNCCDRHKKKQDESYNYLLVMSPREDDEEDDDDRVGSNETTGNPRALRKALDERCREINSFLNKKVLKSLVDMSSETSIRLDQLDHTTFAMQDSIKRDI